MLHLKSLGGPAGDGFRPPQIRWIPESVTTILEDGLLFLALHGLRHEELIAHAPVELTAPDTPLMNLGEVDRDELAQLREAYRTYDFGALTGLALIISVFEGSSILSQLRVLDDYHIDCELLAPMQRRATT